MISLLKGIVLVIAVFIPKTGGRALAFTLTPSVSNRPTRHAFLSAFSEKAESSFLLQDFKTARGEIVEPYNILKISRSASRMDIKKAYRDLSRRYHPDGVRHRDILPGSCNDLDDVREHWERVKLSYEILSDPKLKKKFDRHEALADPGKAVQRAAVDAAFKGVGSIGKGIFDAGAFAFTAIVNHKKKSSKEASMD